MALPQLHWKKISYATGGVNAANTLLDAIYAALQETQYHDTTSRTPGSGSAWTVARYQNTGTTEAVYATPPSSAVSGFRVIVAGVNSGSPTPTMEGSDTHVATFLHCGMNRNSGAFNAWDNAAPFTSGDFSGYWRWVDADLRTYNYVHILESEEAIFIAVEDTSNDIYAIMYGALVDPLSTDPLDEEQTHQRIFLSSKTAHNAALSVDHDSPVFLTGHNATDALQHIKGWMPNGSFGTWSVVYSTIGTGTQDFILPSGAYTSAPILAYNSTTNYALGYLRGVYWSQQDTFGTTISSGGTEKGHFVCGDSAVADQTVIFRSN